VRQRDERAIMSTTGLEVFDKTVQTTNAWLKEIMEVTGPDRHRAYRVLAAVLHALRDRLTVDEAAQLGAQLRILVRGLYYDQWHHPAGKPERLRHKDEFLAEVAAELDDIKPINPEQAARAVFSVLEHHIAPGEIEDIKATLPAHLRELWPSGAVADQVTAGTRTVKWSRSAFAIATKQASRLLRSLPPTPIVRMC
jgi:uncharacterized protein (DUF2267 family)